MRDNNTALQNWPAAALPSSKEAPQAHALRPAPRPAQPASRWRANAVAAGIPGQDDGGRHCPGEGAVARLGVLVTRAREVRELQMGEGGACEGWGGGRRHSTRCGGTCTAGTAAAIHTSCIPPSCSPCLRVGGYGSAQRRCCGMSKWAGLRLSGVRRLGRAYRSRTAPLHAARPPPSPLPALFAHPVYSPGCRRMRTGASGRTGGIISTSCGAGHAKHAGRVSLAASAAAGCARLGTALPPSLDFPLPHWVCLLWSAATGMCMSRQPALPQHPPGSPRAPTSPSRSSPAAAGPAAAPAAGTGWCACACKQGGGSREGVPQGWRRHASTAACVPGGCAAARRRGSLPRGDAARRLSTLRHGVPRRLPPSRRH